MTAHDRFSNINIVIIDDNDTTRAMLRSILRSEGVEVMAEARDGTTGLALVKKHHPNVVCLDVMMPDMSGIEVLTQLKQEFPDIRVIMVTGSTDRDTVQAAIQGGASGYLVKPFNATKVLGALDMAMGRKAQS